MLLTHPDKPNLLADPKMSIWKKPVRASPRDMDTMIKISLCEIIVYMEVLYPGKPVIIIDLSCEVIGPYYKNPNTCRTARRISRTEIRTK